ncbi:unnamed protein product [Parajaminaea phylloscopi]
MQPLKLYSASTPNGQKVHNFLEELKESYPGKFDYEYNAVSLKDNVQKEAWFLKINPNGRIPALVDPNHGDFAVFETAAILLYLEKKYDPEHKFSWPSTNALADNYRSEVLQWMFWVHGGLGPMQGQANHFTRYAPEKIPYAQDRYINETRRLYSVLEERLEGRDWLVGDGRGQYSLADLNAYPWVQWHKWAGLKDTDVGPNLKAWLERNLKRPAVKKGMYMPTGKHEILDKVLSPDFSDADADTHAKESSSWILKGMKEDAGNRL